LWCRAERRRCPPQYLCAARAGTGVQASALYLAGDGGVMEEPEEPRLRTATPRQLKMK
jgi:hypothetical protein